MPPLTIGKMAPIIPAVLATALAAHGIRKKSLSPSGGLAAFVVGYLMMSVPLRGFGISLIIFYLTGSRVTKVGKQLKGNLEEGHNETGYRSGWQVLCNSFSAFIASCLWAAMFAPDSIHSYLFGSILPPHLSWHRANFSMDKTCPVNPYIGGGWSRSLILISLGHFACCLGDTMASELGILSKSPPRLVTTFARVPPGTNGAMSTSGTLASLAGGVIMGLTMFASLMVESAACRADAAKHLASMLFVGALGGVGGSALDSLLGATIQKTEFSNLTNRIITDETKGISRREGEVKTISGTDILSNNQVNLVTSMITGLLLGWLA